MPLEVPGSDLRQLNTSGSGLDLVGVTATTPLMNQARDISFLVKDVDPTIRSVAGGSHPTALPRESLQESAFDFVASGEADYVMADLPKQSGQQPAVALNRFLGGTGHAIVHNWPSILFF